MRCDVSAVTSIILVQSTTTVLAAVLAFTYYYLLMQRQVGMDYCKCFGAESSFLDDIVMRIVSFVCQDVKNLRGSFHEQGLHD